MFLGHYAAITNSRMMGGAEAKSIINAAYFYAIRNLVIGLVFCIALLWIGMRLCS